MGPGWQPIDRNEPGQVEALRMALNDLRGASTDQLRTLRGMFSDGHYRPEEYTDESFERLRSRLLRTIDSGQIPSNIAAEASNGRPWRRRVPEGSPEGYVSWNIATDPETNFFLEEDDAVFRKKVEQARKGYPLRPKFTTAEAVRTEARTRSDAIFRD